MPAQKHVCCCRMVTYPRQHIAFARDYQGDGDDELTYVFVGARQQQLEQLFAFFCRLGIARDFVMEEQHASRQRNGIVHHRKAVRLVGYNDLQIGADALEDIIIARLARETNGGPVDLYDIDTLLNIGERNEREVKKTSVASQEDIKTKSK